MSKMNRPRLGRGFSALLSTPPAPLAESPAVPGEAASARLTLDGTSAATAPPTGPMVLDLPVDAVQPNPHQPRREFNDASLAELAESLRTNGVIQPIVVRQTGDTYELIAGERRLRAAKLAQIETIPAIVRDVDALTQAQLALVENIQREDLNPLDRAQAYRTLMQQIGVSQGDLAARLGQERSSVAHYLRLLDLADSVQVLLRAGGLTLGHAKLLVGMSDLKEQQRLAQKIVQEGLSVRALEKLLQQSPIDSSEDDEPKPPAGSSAYLTNLEKSFSRQLGMRVQIKAGSKKGRGKLVIHYANLDQFDDIKDRLGLQLD